MNIELSFINKTDIEPNVNLKNLCRTNADINCGRRVCISFCDCGEDDDCCDYDCFCDDCDYDCDYYDCDYDCNRDCECECDCSDCLDCYDDCDY